MKGIKYDIKTKKVKKEEDELSLPSALPVEEISVDLNEIRKLLDYAKRMGWI